MNFWKSSWFPASPVRANDISSASASRRWLDDMADAQMRASRSGGPSGRSAMNDAGCSIACGVQGSAKATRDHAALDHHFCLILRCPGEPAHNGRAPPCHSDPRWRECRRAPRRDDRVRRIRRARFWWGRFTGCTPHPPRAGRRARVSKLLPGSCHPRVRLGRRSQLAGGGQQDWTVGWLGLGSVHQI